MPRRLPGTAAMFCLLSLLACMGLGGLWWRSYRVRDAREFEWSGVRWEVATDKGRVLLGNGPQQRVERAPLTEAEQQLAVALRRLVDVGVFGPGAARIDPELVAVQKEALDRYSTA